MHMHAENKDTCNQAAKQLATITVVSPDRNNVREKKNESEEVPIPRPTKALKRNQSIWD